MPTAILATRRSPVLPKCSLWRLSCVGPVLPVQSHLQEGSTLELKVAEAEAPVLFITVPGCVTSVIQCVKLKQFLSSTMNLKRWPCNSSNKPPVLITELHDAPGVNPAFSIFGPMYTESIINVFHPPPKSEMLLCWTTTAAALHRAALVSMGAGKTQREVLCLDFNTDSLTAHVFIVPRQIRVASGGRKLFAALTLDNVLVPAFSAEGPGHRRKLELAVEARAIGYAEKDNLAALFTTCGHLIWR